MPFWSWCACEHEGAIGVAGEACPSGAVEFVNGGDAGETWNFEISGALEA